MVKKWEKRKAGEGGGSREPSGRSEKGGRPEGGRQGGRPGKPAGPKRFGASKPGPGGSGPKRFGASSASGGQGPKRFGASSRPGSTGSKRFGASDKPAGAGRSGGFDRSDRPAGKRFGVSSERPERPAAKRFGTSERSERPAPRRFDSSDRTERPAARRFGSSSRPGGAPSGPKRFGGTSSRPGTPAFKRFGTSEKSSEERSPREGGREESRGARFGGFKGAPARKEFRPGSGGERRSAPGGDRPSFKPARPGFSKPRPDDTSESGFRKRFDRSETSRSSQDKPRRSFREDRESSSEGRPAFRSKPPFKKGPGKGRDFRPTREGRQPVRPVRTYTEGPKDSPLPQVIQKFHLDRTYTAAQLGILRVAYGSLSRDTLAAHLQDLQTRLRSSGGEAVCRAFSRVPAEDKDFWVIWEDSATGKFYFTADRTRGIDIPFELPADWFRPADRILKWREETETGRMLHVLRHKAAAAESRDLSPETPASETATEETQPGTEAGTE